LVPDEVLAQGWNHKIKAHFYRAQGEWQQAVSMYTKILEGNPTDAMTYVHRSRSKTRLGDQSGALSDLNQAVNLLPGRPDFLAQRSLIKDAIGDLAGSAVDARFALNLHDQLHVIWAHRAEAKRRLGNYHGALDDATLSLKLDPSLVKALLTRGASHLALGNKKEASRDLAHARKLAPEEGPRVDTLLTSGPEPCLTALPSHGTRVRDAGKCACSELVSVTEASDMLGAF